ncbi:MAG: endonuclease III [Clostridium sp.]|nr:endonuclease III [Clostridium sp.]
MDIKTRIETIIKIFNKMYSDVKCTLDYENALELLVATQLSAQCTDVRVNIVTKTLFQKYKNVEDFANADLNELETYLKSTGLYRNKARNIKQTCKIIIDKYGGKVPDNLNDLLTLPGVGRKTANVVLGEIFNVPSIIVDTHAKRLSNRIGLSHNTSPHKIELDLMGILPKKEWTGFSHRLVRHGREVCTARKPNCSSCRINKYCDYAKNDEIS